MNKKTFLVILLLASTLFSTRVLAKARAASQAIDSRGAYTAPINNNYAKS